MTAKRPCASTKKQRTVDVSATSIRINGTDFGTVFLLLNGVNQDVFCAHMWWCFMVFCLFAAAEIQLIYSEKQLRHLATAISNRKLTKKSLSKTLSTLLSIAECNVFAYENGICFRGHVKTLPKSSVSNHYILKFRTMSNQTSQSNWVGNHIYSFSISAFFKIFKSFDLSIYSLKVV